MGIKSTLSKPYAKSIIQGIKKWSGAPVKTQQKVFNNLLLGAENTLFGKEHDFSKISSYSDFKKAVPIRDYEALTPYINRVVEGEDDVLWKGKPIYLSKTSGTTSGAKFIPITKESISHHIRNARNAILFHILNTGDTSFINGKMIFLSGSPELIMKNGIPVGRLSGIVNHHVPDYLRKSQLPSYETNIISDWEQKVDAIVEETINQDMRLISGIPSWVQMYFDRILEKSGKKTIKEVFPNFNLFIHGGVNYEPYKAGFEATIGGEIGMIETYPASEGFIAYQDTTHEEGLLLALNSGMFFEFIPMDEIHSDNPTRLSIGQVELNTNYAIVLNTNAGLWGYLIGDTVRFVSLAPYRVVVTGRIKHFISAFGEHVISEEVDRALLSASEKFDIRITEFTVAPQVSPVSGLPYHEWFIEFEEQPQDLDTFALAVDNALQSSNIYYKDLLEGNILRTLVIRPMRKNAFIEYMKSKGKLGGQNKVPRLSNDRKIADELLEWSL